MTGAGWGLRPVARCEAGAGRQRGRWRVRAVVAVVGVVGVMWALLFVGPLTDAVKKRRRRG